MVGHFYLLINLLLEVGGGNVKRYVRKHRSFLKQLISIIPILHLGRFPKQDLEDIFSPHVHCSISHIIPKVEVIQMFINR